MKTCIKCNLERPIDSFYKNNRTKGGYKNTCKDCQRVWYKSRYKYKVYPEPKSLDGEEWRDIRGFNGEYKVSNFGRIKSKRTILKSFNSGQGYLFVTLYKNKKQFIKYVHKAVAQEFVPNPENKPHINHINSDRNFNYPSNLEWCTPQENVTHSIEFGFRDGKGVNNWCAKLNDDAVRFIRNNHHKGFSVRELANKYGVTIHNIYHVIWNKTWTHVNL